MKKIIAALALTAAAATAPAFAGNVGISISVGEPGFYGQLDIGGYGRPSLVYSEPVLLSPRYRSYAPVYVRAPRDHYRNWGRYCGRYDACSRPAYFVRDEWYSGVYAPRYRQNYYGRNGRDYRHDNRWDNRNDRRDWRGDRRDDRREEYRDRRDGRRDGNNDRRDDRNDWRDHH